HPAECRWRRRQVLAVDRRGGARRAGSASDLLRSRRSCDDDCQRETRREAEPVHRGHHCLPGVLRRWRNEPTVAVGPCTQADALWPPNTSRALQEDPWGDERLPALT